MSPDFAVALPSTVSGGTYVRPYSGHHRWQRPRVCLAEYSEPEDDASDVYSGQKLVPPLLIAGGQRLEILEPIDGAFHHVAPFVGFSVEFRRTTSPTSVLDILG